MWFYLRIIRIFAAEMLSRQECIDKIRANAKKIIEVMPLKNGTRLPNRLLIAKK